MTPLLETIRAEAAGRDVPAVDAAADDWRCAESAIADEVARSAGAGQDLVDAFERVADRDGSPGARGRAARLRASALFSTGRFDASLRAYDRASALLRGAPREGALLGKAASLIRCGRWSEAIGICRRVRRAARRAGRQRMAAVAEMQRGVACLESGSPEHAIGPLNRARDEFRALSGDGDIAFASENLALALMRCDRLTEAESALAETERILTRLGLAREAAHCIYNRGALLASLDRLGDAERLLRDAEERLRAVGDDEQAALARIDRGDVLLRARLIPEALHALRTGRAELGRGAPAYERCRARLLLARALIAGGDAIGARRLLLRTAAFPALESERLELRGRAWLALDRPRRARGDLIRAADGFGKALPIGRARCLTAAAWCALESGDLVDAGRLVASARRLAARVPVPGVRFGAEAVAFLAAADAGRRAAADAALSRSLDALEEVRAGLGPDAMRAALLAGSEAWFARAMRHLLAGDDGEARALGFLERWRARALTDLLGSARAEPADGRVAALAARVSSLERRLGGQGQPGFLRHDGAPQRDRADLARAESELRDAVAGSGRAPVQPPFDLARLRTRLEPGTVVLALHGDERGVVAFSVGDSVDAVRSATPAAELRAAVEELSYRLGKFTLGPEFVARQSGRLRREVERLLAVLAERTLGPVPGLIRSARRLVVVPDPSWYPVPFAALPFDGAPLVSTVAVELAPSLAALSDDVPEPLGAPIVLAYADARAPTIVEEGRRVAATLPGAELLEGEHAVAAALLGRQAPRCLHIASHGRFRIDAPGFSGVRLADGWLRAIDFRNLRLEGSLVVLSGCDTGVAVAAAGAEVTGLVRAVLAAGAAELVVSLWRVDDAATTRLMTRFHGHRRDGLSAAEALRASQAGLAAEGLHPWYWAGFSLWTRRLRA